MKFLIVAVASLVMSVSAFAGGHTSKGTVLVVGSTGKLGSMLVDALKKDGYKVRAMARNAEKAKEKLGDAEVVIADLMDSTTLSAPVQGVDYVISAVSSKFKAKDPKVTETVEYTGMQALIDNAAKAGVKKWVMVSSGGITQPNHFMNKNSNNMLVWKGKAEDALRASGMKYSIVRPAGAMLDKPSGVSELIFDQGDKPAKGFVMIARGDALTVTMAAFKDDNANSKTFELINGKGKVQADLDLSAVFAGLEADK